jgi:hypothetical protein
MPYEMRPLDVSFDRGPRQFRHRSAKTFSARQFNPKFNPNGGNLDFLRNQSQRKKRKRTLDNLSRLELGNAVLLGKFSDELEKETNCNQRDSKATAPTHEPRMPNRSP